MLQEDVFTARECEHYCRLVRAFDQTLSLGLIERRTRGRSLRYKVVDGLRITEAIPNIDELSARVESVLERICGLPLVPVEDPLAARNINITPPGGEYRWHYDRNAVTAIVYLNEVDGGETEIFPNHRIVVRDGRLGRFQQVLDHLVKLRPVRLLVAHRRMVVPRQGTLLIMRGDLALHSVRRVLGSQDRITLILAYDVPGRIHQRNVLNHYLYTTTPLAAGDPNYEVQPAASTTVERRKPAPV